MGEAKVNQLILEGGRGEGEGGREGGRKRGEREGEGGRKRGEREGEREGGRERGEREGEGRDRGRGYSRRHGHSEVPVHTPDGSGGRRRTLTHCCLMCRGYPVTPLERYEGGGRRKEEKEREKTGGRREEKGEDNVSHTRLTCRLTFCSIQDKQARSHLVYLPSG